MDRIVLFVSCILVASFTHAKVLPVEAFGNLPVASNVKLSPDGTKFAFTRIYAGLTLIGVTDLAKDKTAYVVKTDNQKFKIGWYRWANEEMLLVSVDYPRKRRDIRFTETRLLKVNADGSNTAEPVIIPKDGDHMAQFQNNIVDLLPEEPNHILMSIDLLMPNRPDVYKIDLSKKRSRKLIYRGKTDITNWMTDRQHRLRIGYGRDETTIFYRLYDTHTEKWRNVWEYEIFNVPDTTPLGFGLNPDELYIRADHNGRYAIFKVDVSKPELPRTLIFSDENYDVEGSLIYSDKTNDVIGVYHGEADNAKVYFDQRYEKFQRALNKAIPDSYNNIVSMSDNERRYILYSSNSRSPGAYFWGDRDSGELIFVLDQYPMLTNQTLSGKQKITYQARDGVEIEAYVTFPHEGVPSHNAALVIPHGGPMARNYSGFDWFSEFFASRGYLVIEPNFRGSSGYGFEFEMESVQKWGGVMQDDLADAANWLRDSYEVDAGKICILGASYGGYAALMAAVKQKDTFKCAASFAGVSDLEYIVRKARRFTNSKIVKKQIGDDSDRLEQNSPVNFAEQMNIPVLLIHGDQDVVVDVYHSREMFDELEDEDKNVQYIELENGNHHLEIEKNRVQTLKAFDEFLQKHLADSD